MLSLRNWLIPNDEKDVDEAQLQNLKCNTHLGIYIRHRNVTLLKYIFVIIT